MVIQMTREEYKKKFGVEPVLPKPSAIDTSVAPRKMTRAEYEAEFGQKTEAQVPEAVQGIKRYQDSAAKAFLEGGQQLDKGLQDFSSTSNPLKKIEAGVTGASGIINTLYASLAPLTTPVFEAATKGVMKTANFINNLPNKIQGKPSTDITDNPLLQKFAMSKAGEVTERVVTDVANVLNVAGGVAGLELPKGLPMKEKYSGPTSSIEPVPPPEPPRAVRKVATEIENVENNYSGTRKANDKQGIRANESRIRIAESGVLDNAVDNNGLIRTKQAGGAVERYYEASPLKSSEAVVKDNLKKEGKTLPLPQVEKELTLAASKLFEGSDLINALNGVKREVLGLAQRADELGNIALEKIHDAKINKTRQIDYAKDNNKTITYRKAIAQVYKKLIENNSEVKVTVNGKEYRIKGVNKELAKYYADMERLINLDGRKVQGGRLGKYAAQVTGNIAGTAGGAVLGFPGAMAGSLIGGELGKLVQGKMMARNFKGVKEGRIPRNEILEAARQQAHLPAEQRNPSIPDLKVGAPKSVPKTKEIVRIEAQIDRNVKAQKAAIKAGDFTLVQKLKVVYDALVAKLKEIILAIKNTPNKQGGFISIGKRNTEFPAAFEPAAKKLVEKMQERNTGIAKSRPQDALNDVKKRAIEWRDLRAQELGVPVEKIRMQKFFESEMKKMEEAPKPKGTPGVKAKAPKGWEVASENLLKEMQAANYKYSNVDAKGMLETINKGADEYMQRIGSARGIDWKEVSPKRYYDAQFENIRTLPKPQARITDPAKIQRDTKLTGKDAEVQEASIKYAIENQDKILEANIEKNKGVPVINTDDFRPYFKDVGYNGSNSAAVHEASKYLAGRALSEALSNPRGHGVVGMAGGSGVGKTTAVNTHPFLAKIKDSATAVLDSNFSDWKSTASKIRQVQKAGQTYQHVYVYRDFLDALVNGVVDRMFTNKGEMGRVVPNKVTAENHIGSWDVVKKLYREGVEGKTIDIIFIDNSLGWNKSKILTFDEMAKKIKYPPLDVLKKMANEAVQKVYKEGHVSGFDKQSYKMTEAQLEQYLKGGV